MHESYMSSLRDDSTEPRTTPGGTTPSSKSRGFATPRRDSGSIYTDSEAYDAFEPLQEIDTKPEASMAESPYIDPQIVRQASVGKRAKAAMTDVRARGIHPEQAAAQENTTSATTPPTTRTAMMNVLSAAVAAGMSIHPQQRQNATPEPRTRTPIRMPFDGSPSSSPMTDREEIQPPQFAEAIPSGRTQTQTPMSGSSAQSSNPLLGLGIEQRAMSDKIPPSRRPPRLDMGAVREAENRGSTTSLADLIRRATKLAANLDRGKTASRIGMLDMFGSTEKLGSTERHSTMSDMISAFPAPATGGTPRRETTWPLSEKDGGSASLKRGKEARRLPRRCCGLSLPIFIGVFVLLIALIAAAVLIPVFLILVPRQRGSHVNLSHCSQTDPCQNGGVSIVSSNACNCVCANGFIGDHCQMLGTSGDCTTTTVTDGSNKYQNATMGLSITPLFSDAQSRFDIPLNASILLSVFSANNLSCTSENSLVDFNSSTLNEEVTRRKRFVILPGFNSQVPTASLPLHAIPHVTQRGLLPLEARSDGVTIGTSNGIVFQATSTGTASTPAEPTDSGVASASTSAVTSFGGTSTALASSSSSSSPTPTSSSTGPVNVTESQVEFAKIVVLYVLEQSGTLSVAVNAQQRLEEFFVSENRPSSATVDVGFGALNLTADLDTFEIVSGDGSKIGGGSAANTSAS